MPRHFYRDPLTNDKYEYDDDQVASGVVREGLEPMMQAEIDSHLNPPLTKEQIIQGYTDALERHYDAEAQSHRYDNRFTCALRAGYPGPFQAEGIAFAVWMDDCNAYAYRQLAEVEARRRVQPSPGDLVLGLPPMVWPV